MNSETCSACFVAAKIVASILRARRILFQESVKFKVTVKHGRKIIEASQPGLGANMLDLSSSFGY